MIRALGSLAVLTMAASAPLACQKRVREQPAPVAVVAARPVSPPAPPEPPAPPQESGVWAVSDAYDLKLLSVARCAGDRLGLRLRIRSKVKSFFVGPRDAVLHDGDQRFEALLAPDYDGCRPALAAAHVRRDQETEGFVVFELGREAKKPVLEFAPTRWGGAGPVRVAVRD